MTRNKQELGRWTRGKESNVMWGQMVMTTMMSQLVEAGEESQSDTDDACRVLMCVQGM